MSGVPIKENGYFESTTNNLYQDQAVAGSRKITVGHYTNFPNSDGSDAGLISINNINGFSTEEEEDINYCSDDLFSSFLNSMINEDAAFAA